jgi:tripartite-type tricarboxylate transporter receptor subunit TctC
VRSAFARVLLGTALALAGVAPVAAQPYPSKPIRIIVPFPAGGIADIYARLIGTRLTQAWGQPVVVENRTGAGGNIGADAVAKSPPDGYTLGMGSVGTHAVNVSLFSKMPYDPVRDFAPIALVLEAEGLLVVHPSVPAQTVPELIAFARANPGKLTFASAGMGTASHLAGELFKTRAGVDMVHVPYKGNAPAITDLLAGQTALIFATMPTVLPHARAGKLRALATIGKTRSAAAPDLPTVSEGGAARLRGEQLIGLFAPRARRRDRAAAERGGAAHHALAGSAGAPAGRGRALRRDHAGRIRRLREDRGRELGADRQGVRGPGRLTRAGTISRFTGRPAAHPELSRFRAACHPRAG